MRKLGLVTNCIQGQAEIMRRITTFVVVLQCYLGLPKPSFHCARKLFTIINILRIRNQIQDVPNYLKEFYKQCSVSFFLPFPVDGIKQMFFQAEFCKHAFQKLSFSFPHHLCLVDVDGVLEGVADEVDDHNPCNNRQGINKGLKRILQNLRDKNLDNFNWSYCYTSSVNMFICMCLFNAFIFIF